MKKIIIKDRKDGEIIVTENGIVPIMGNEGEVLSGVPEYIAWLYPFQVAFPSPTEPKVSAVFKKGIRMVNGVQTDQFYVYGNGGFQWVNCSVCQAVFIPPS